MIRLQDSNGRGGGKVENTKFRKDGKGRWIHAADVWPVSTSGQQRMLAVRKAQKGVVSKGGKEHAINTGRTSGARPRRAPSATHPT